MGCYWAPLKGYLTPSDLFYFNHVIFSLISAGKMQGVSKKASLIFQQTCALLWKNVLLVWRMKSKSFQASVVSSKGKLGFLLQSICTLPCFGVRGCEKAQLWLPGKCQQFLLPVTPQMCLVTELAAGSALFILPCPEEHNVQFMAAESNYPQTSLAPALRKHVFHLKPCWDCKALTPVEQGKGRGAGLGTGVRTGLGESSGDFPMPWSGCLKEGLDMIKRIKE